MVSAVGPQLGFFFHACMDGRDVVIRQSPLYSFEKRETAHWDFFSRILLSSPLLEDENDGLIAPHV
jgi:hypothetical protein